MAEFALRFLYIFFRLISQWQLNRTNNQRKSPQHQKAFIYPFNMYINHMPKAGYLANELWDSKKKRICIMPTFNLLKFDYGKKKKKKKKQNSASFSIQWIHLWRVILPTTSQPQAQTFTFYYVTVELELYKLHFLDFFAGWLLVRLCWLEALVGDKKVIGEQKEYSSCFQF